MVSAIFSFMTEWFWNWIMKLVDKALFQIKDKQKMLLIV